MYKFSHGGDIYSFKEKYNKNFIDFSANINPLGLHPLVKMSIINNIDSVIHYPDPYCRELTKKMSEKLNIEKDYILFGNGAAELTFKIVQAVKPKKALLLAPTFLEYENALKSVNCNIEFYNLKECLNYEVQNDILNFINNSIDILFICNPNNPTGVMVDKALLEQVVEKCKKTNTTLVVDECFIEFLENEKEHTLIPLLNKYDNVIILRAFTKIYAIPGLRLGYILSSNKSFLLNIVKNSQPWGVSTLAMHSGIACLSLENYVNDTKKLIKQNRSFLVDHLKDFDFTVFPSEANFVLFKTNVKNIKLLLEQNGILIRNCDDYHLLNKNFYRVAVKSINDIQILLNNIKNIIQNNKI